MAINTCSRQSYLLALQLGESQESEAGVVEEDETETKAIIKSDGSQVKELGLDEL